MTYLLIFSLGDAPNNWHNTKLIHTNSMTPTKHHSVCNKKLTLSK